MPDLVENNRLLQTRLQRHRRLRHGMEIEVRADGVAETSQCNDISAGGLFLDSGQSFEVGTVIYLAFQLDGHLFETRARVVHARPHRGYGVQFLDFSAAQRNQILRFVHKERATREAERLVRHDGWVRVR